MELHPDRQKPQHEPLSSDSNSDPSSFTQSNKDKNNTQSARAATELFRQVTEAYKILSNHKDRVAYDHMTWKDRRKRNPPPANYRKVYTSPMTPDMTRMYNFERDWDMHYGDGMMREALKEALDNAIREGEVDLEYRSVLGPGFSFHKSNATHLNTNPFSKNVKQGPKHFSPKMMFDYEEGHMFESSTSKISDAKSIIYKREQIVQNMQDRRMERVERRKREAEARERGDTGCIIM